MWSISKHKDKRAFGECLGICYYLKLFLRWKKKSVRWTRKSCYTKCSQDLGTCHLPLHLPQTTFCVQYNLTYAQHALSRSSWAPQSLANLICESMGFSHCNNKSLWHATGYTSQQHLRASSIPPGMTWGLLPAQLEQHSTHEWDCLFGPAENFFYW